MYVCWAIIYAYCIQMKYILVCRYHYYFESIVVVFYIYVAMIYSRCILDTSICLSFVSDKVLFKPDCSATETSLTFPW